MAPGPAAPGIRVEPAGPLRTGDAGLRRSAGAAARSLEGGQESRFGWAAPGRAALCANGSHGRAAVAPAGGRLEARAPGAGPPERALARMRPERYAARSDQRRPSEGTRRGRALS